MTHFKKFMSASLFVFGIPVFSFAVPASVSFPTAVNSGAGSNTSLNWSGYASTQGAFTSITGSWTVPAVAAASSTMADATWVGIGGISSSDLIQAGTQAITDLSGSVAYQAWYELLPDDMQTIASLPVRAGDSMTASLTQTASGVWQIALNDRTTGGTYTTNVNYHSSLSSAEWIEEMPTANIGRLALDNFGIVSFTGGSVTQNGSTTATIAQSGGSVLTMVTNGGTVLASPSALGSDGASFTVTRTSANALPSGGYHTSHAYVGGSHWHVGVSVNGYGHKSESSSPSSMVDPSSFFPWVRVFRNFQSQFQVRFERFR